MWEQTPEGGRCSERAAWARVGSALLPSWHRHHSLGQALSLLRAMGEVLCLPLFFNPSWWALLLSHLTGGETEARGVNRIMGSWR